MDFFFKRYAMVMILREQLEHVDGLVDKQEFRLQLTISFKVI